jgi:hypothetical protein
MALQKSQSKNVREQQQELMALQKSQSKNVREQ